MSLRKLPDVQNFQEPEGFESAPNLDAFDNWNPALRIKADASSAGATVIDILDQIGKDPWTGEGVGAADVAAQLKGAGAVIVNINSLGGSFYAGVAIFNLLKQHAGKVTVNVLGLAASAASIIMMAGDDIRMGPAAFVLIHNGQGAVAGDRHDMANAVTNLSAIDSAIADLYVARTGKHKNSIATMMDNETLMNAADAIKYGFADSTIERNQIVEDAQALVTSHPLKDKRLAEAIFANAGVPRSKRRSMFAAIKAGPTDPNFIASDAMADMRGEIVKLRDALRGLLPANAAEDETAEVELTEEQKNEAEAAKRAAAAAGTQDAADVPELDAGQVTALADELRAFVKPPIAA